MSKIGKKPINILTGVEVKLQGDKLEVKGPKGTLSLEVDPLVKVEIKEKEILVSPTRKTKEAGAIWGLTRSLINNLVVGVTEGYEKKLELQGVGYRMNIQGNKIVLALGFSHPVEKEIPQDLTVKLEENNILSVWGIDKQKVGQFSAEVRALKKAEPYKGKGFRYQGEQVRRKVGKKAAVAK
jgi:large subunit ribosomal protein L6